MLYHSYEFIIFLPIVYLLYWIILYNKTKSQNLLILISSYIFYGWWDWHFLALILISSFTDFFVGIKIGKCKTKSWRKTLLYISLIVNLGTLLLFKYANFFIDSFAISMAKLGVNINPITLQIILPVGISFYTFQTLSYTVDIYNNKIKPTKNFITFAAFVSFFPQLIAGPIERASNLLPQFKHPRTFKYKNAVEGLRQILWGLFKKVVIADNCAVFANLIFSNYTEYNASSLVLGAFFFSFQIYGDFSGYTDIAIGVARLFGFKLVQNFSYPYFSRDIAEFWRRWHISLTTWFRDYVFIPLGGSRGSKWNTCRNILIVFLLSGFWHGANWTFIIWGFIHVLLYLPLIFTGKHRVHISIVANSTKLPTIRDISLMLLTFTLVTISWIFFRAETVDHAINYIFKSLSFSLFHIPNIPNRLLAVQILVLIFFFLTIEWHGRHSEYAISRTLLNKTPIIRYTFYYLLVTLLFLYGGNQHEFIYFQF